MLPQQSGYREREEGGVTQAAVLVRLWELSDRLCGKLLAPLLPDLVEALERHGELRLEPEIRAALLALSPATIDRLLRPHRLPRARRQRPAASPSLQAQVPMRTFGEWRDVAPGALQADLVLHSGARTQGFYLSSVVAVDVATGWSALDQGCRHCPGWAGRRPGRCRGYVRPRAVRLGMACCSRAFLPRGGAERGRKSPRPSAEGAFVPGRGKRVHVSPRSPSNPQAD